MFGNIRKILKAVGRQPSVQPPIQKGIFCTNSQQLGKSRYERFQVQFCLFLYFTKYILLEIVDTSPCLSIPVSTFPYSMLLTDIVTDITALLYFSLCLRVFFWTSATPVLKDLAKLFLRHSSNIQQKEQLLQPLYFLKYELKSRLTLFSYSFLVSLFSSICLMNKSPLSVIFHLLASQINGFCWVINSSLSKAFISFKTFFGHSLLPNSNFQFLMDLTDKWLYDYPLLEVYCCCC